MEEKLDLLRVGQEGDYERYEVMPSTVVDAVEGVQTEFITRYGHDSDGGFADAEDDDRRQTISIGGRQYEYVPWGGDNMLPYHVQVLIGKNMVTSQCQQFNSLTCYGHGLQFFNRGTEDRASNPEIRNFCLRNALHLQFWEQATDMKYYFFSVLVITLSRDGSKIVQLRHQGKRSAGTADHSFAVVCKVPTVGHQIYPMPYYYSIFLDAWYDIYRLIGTGKRYMIKNTAAPRWQVEIHRNYWNNVCNEEGITDPEKR